MILLTSCPAILALIAIVAYKRAALMEIPFLTALASIPSAVRNAPGRLKLKKNVQKVFADHETVAVPSDVEIMMGDQLLGNDEGVLLTEGDALVFTGNICRFVLYNDMLMDREKALALAKKSGESNDPAQVVLRLDIKAGVLKIRIRQRSFKFFAHDSGRLGRVIRDWKVRNTTRPLSPILPPLEPTPEARYSISSAYSWSLFSFAMSVGSWFYLKWLLGLRGYSLFSAERIVFFTMGIAVSSVFIAFGVFGFRIARKRKKFYASCGTPEPSRVQRLAGS